MNISKPIVLTPNIESRFQSFILIETTSSRLGEADIFIQGSRVREIYNQLMDSLLETDDIKNQIIHNRIAKIGQMMDLLSNSDGIYMTKFFDRVWRRYSYVSNVGEAFLDLPTFLTYFPEYAEDKYALLAQRIDDEDDDMGSVGGDAEGEEGARPTEDRDENIEEVDTIETMDIEKETIEA